MFQAFHKSPPPAIPVGSLVSFCDIQGCFAGGKATSLEAQAAAKQRELNAVVSLLRDASNLHARLTDTGSGSEALADLASAADLDAEVRTWALHELSSTDERFAALVAEAQLMASGHDQSGGRSA